MTVQATEIELDSGPRDREIERMCAATRTVRPVSDLIRYVIGPGGEAVPDLKHKLPGRGVWVTATQGALGDAIQRKVFARGFKRDVRLPADLLARTEDLLERSALDARSPARPPWSPPGSPEWRRPWRMTTWSPFYMRPKPRPTGSGSWMLHCAAGRGPVRSP